jgi:hypothetical protein
LASWCQEVVAFLPPWSSTSLSVPFLSFLDLIPIVDMFRVADISLQRLDTWIAVCSKKCSFISCVPLHWLLSFVVFPWLGSFLRDLMVWWIQWLVLFS